MSISLLFLKKSYFSFSSECLKIEGLIKACQLLEVEMQKGTNINMNKLEPRFSLVGSIPEGTRIGKAVEIDVVLQLMGLQQFPFRIHQDNAMKLYIDESNHPLVSFSTNSQFDIVRLFIELHHHTKEALFKIEDKLPQGLSIAKVDHFCSECLKIRDDTKVFAPYKHCAKCLFPVTHTKVGPCLIFKWELNTVLTVDLVPVFPIKTKSNSIVDSMNCVTKTLINKRPPFWLSYFNGFIEKDRLLPEEFEADVVEEKKVIEVGFKLLHHGTENNWIIRPAQVMKIQKVFMESPYLKSIYVHLKTLKLVLNINIKSYFLKKVLLRKEVTKMINSFQRSDNTYEESKLINGLLFEIMSFPEVKVHFEGKIDFAKWKTNFGNTQQIPIKAEYLPIKLKGRESLTLITQQGDHDQKIIIDFDTFFAIY